MTEEIKVKVEKKQKRNYKKKNNIEYYVDGELFTVTGLKRKMVLAGEDPKTYRKHKDYIEYMRLVREKHKVKSKKKRELKKAGKIAKHVPLINHPSALMPIDTETKDLMLEAKIRKSVTETIDMMDMIKRIAKSKIRIEVRDMLKKKRTLSPEDVKDISTFDLKELAMIVQVASKTQVEVGSRYFAGNLIVKQPNQQSKGKTITIKPIKKLNSNDIDSMYQELLSEQQNQNQIDEDGINSPLQINIIDNQPSNQESKKKPKDGLKNFLEDMFSGSSEYNNDDEE